MTASSSSASPFPTFKRPNVVADAQHPNSLFSGPTLSTSRSSHDALPPPKNLDVLVPGHSAELAHNALTLTTASLPIHAT